jgi:hypothetical protein
MLKAIGFIQLHLRNYIHFTVHNSISNLETGMIKIHQIHKIHGGLYGIDAIWHVIGIVDYQPIRKATTSAPRFDLKRLFPVQV